MRLTRFLHTWTILLVIILMVHSSEVDVRCNPNRPPICFVKTNIAEVNTSIKITTIDFAVKILHFKDTTVKFLPNDISKFYPNLTGLKVTKSKLKAIEKFNFKGLGQLTEIDFESNEISELPEDVFEFLVNLNKINLNFNSLKILPSKVFSKNTKLTYISLSNNSIEKISDQTFKNLINLQILNLDSNQIQELDSGTFDDCKELTTIQLHHNEIGQVAADIFKNNQKLKISIKNIETNKCINDHMDEFVQLNESSKVIEKITEKCKKKSKIDILEDQITDLNNELKKLIKRVEKLESNSGTTKPAGGDGLDYNS